MTTTIEALQYYARRSPARIAIRSAQGQHTYRSLLDSATSMARVLQRENVHVLALVADNGAAWIVADIAAQIAKIVLVPIPPFFSAEQTRHALRDSGADAVASDAVGSRQIHALGGEIQAKTPIGDDLHLSFVRQQSATARLPRNTAKVSYTSGTTGSPKGVCLSQIAMDSVAQSLWAATASLDIKTHLCALPLATLLENIAGVYAPLRNGAEIVAPSLYDVGIAGSTHFDVSRFLGCIAKHEPHSIILLPQMLAALVTALEAGAPRPGSLRFAAVGGARVPMALLERAARLGLPVYEGYGLTECASVVALNTPAANRAGSVGCVLPHASVHIDEHSEIRISGRSVCGYVGATHDSVDEIATGDLGRIDADGFLYVTGRRKNVFITSFGRNVSPDWVEAELTRGPPIAQAALFGEARPWNVAVIVPSDAAVTAAEIQTALDAINTELPDYARAGDWVRADESFSPLNGLLTPNGRNRRGAIWNRYADLIDACYRDSIAV